jgi:hypothetical protein
MILMSEMPAEDAHDVIHHGGRVVAVVVPIGEYQQLRQAMQEQQVNEEFDAARARYLARREAGRSATCPMGKRADAWACRPGELSVNWEIQALDQAAGFLRDDPIGVAALWDSASQPADEPTAAGVVPTCGTCQQPGGTRQPGFNRCCSAARTGSQTSSASSRESVMSTASISRRTVHPPSVGLISQVRYVGGSCSPDCST